MKTKNKKIKKILKVLSASALTVAAALSLASTGTSVYAQENEQQPYQQIKSNMSIDEMIKAVGKNPSDYSTYNDSLENIYKTQGEESYYEYIKHFNNMMDVVGIGEGVENGTCYTYFIFKALNTYEDSPYFTTPTYMELAYTSDTQTNQMWVKSEGDGATFQNGNFNISSTSKDIAQGVTVLRAPVYKEEMMIQDHILGIDKISIWDGVNDDYGYVQKITYDSSTGDSQITSNGIPNYTYARADDGQLKLIFDNCNAKTVIKQVVINSIRYDVAMDVFDSATSRIQVSIPDITLNETKTYNIEYVSYNDKTIDVNKAFRYVSKEDEESWSAVKAEINVSYNDFLFKHWTNVDFNIIDPYTGDRIETVKTAQCYYTYKGKTYSPTAKVRNFFNNVFTFQYQYLVFTKDKQGEITYKYVDTDYRYVWQFGIHCENVDCIYITYKVNGQIVNGSCYKDGLHVENGEVVDIYGNVHDDVSIEGDNVLVDNETGNLLNTENDITISDESKTTAWDKISTSLSEFFNKLGDTIKIPFIIVGTLVLLFGVLKLITLIKGAIK